MLTPEKVVEQTEKWILDVVVGLNFCPFASNVVKQQKIFYRVEMSSELHTCLNTVLQELLRLDDNAGIETSFVIFPNAFENFNDYLDMVWLAEKQLKNRGIKVCTNWQVFTRSICLPSQRKKMQPIIPTALFIP